MNNENTAISELRARERYKNFEARFFQTIALPGKTDNRLHSVSQNNTQWRIDFSSMLKKEINPLQKSILGIAFKILTRGVSALFYHQVLMVH
jgi:hypothetical protein